MKEQEWRFRDRTGWHEGPWDGEPDKVQWVDAVTGLPCMIHRNPYGAWCGYVGVGPKHPHYQKPIEAVDDSIRVHGGLTFADGCDRDFNPATGQGICHIPEPGEPDDVWWFGFDCSHAFDLSPGLGAKLRALPKWLDIEDTALKTGSFFEGEVYRDIGYAKGECADLASQLFRRSFETI